MAAEQRDPSWFRFNVIDPFADAASCVSRNLRDYGRGYLLVAVVMAASVYILEVLAVSVPLGRRLMSGVTLAGFALVWLRYRHVPPARPARGWRTPGALLFASFAGGFALASFAALALVGAFGR
ncbi:MAG: hypothetical protein R3C39_08980 [Dehalococcoidia bacterium]